MKRQMDNIRKFAGTAVLGIGMGLGLSVLSIQAVQAQSSGVAMPPTPVIVSAVEQKPIVEEVEALGTLRANESVDLTSTVTELVTDVLFQDGQRVSKGDVLVKMDAAEEEAELVEEQSLLEEAKRQVDRIAPLAAKGAASESILDERRREVETANARIKAIRSRISKRQITAPFDGVVGLRNVSTGALAQPGTLMTTIDDDRVMKLDFSVPSVFLSVLEPGAKILAQTKAYPAETFEGTLVRVDSRIDPITRAVLVRALIENPDRRLKPGLLMRVVLQKKPRETLVIPEEAVVPSGSQYHVLVVQDTENGQTVAKKKVELGVRRQGEVEVLSGVEPGDLVVTHGTMRAIPGKAVSVTAEEDGNQTLEEMMGGDDK